MKPNDVELQATNELLDKHASKPEPHNIWFSKRFYVVLLLFFGCVNINKIRANISIALVEMTSNKTIIIGNETFIEPPDYNWNTKTVGVVISMFSYGNLFSIFGGYLTTKYGGARLFGFSVAGASILTLLSPMSLRTNFYLFLASLVIAGILESFAYASTAEILSRWAPMRERSTLMSYSYTGMYVGAATTYPFCGYIAHTWGWPMTFYATGVLSFVWSILWLILVRNDPSEDKRISKKELAYIKDGADTPQTNVSHPYRKIIRSSAFWALAGAKFTYSIGFTILVYCFPLYVKDLTGKSTDQIGLISSIPQIICIISVPLVGIFLDYCQNHSTLKTTQIHKTLLTIGYLTGASLFAAVTYINSFIIAMVCFVFIKVMSSFNFVILQLVCLYMAPQHSSALAGLSAFWFTVGNIVTPTVVGFMGENHSAEEWSRIFLMTAAALITGGIVFLFFGSSELQPWAVQPKSQIEQRPIVKNKKSSER